MANPINNPPDLTGQTAVYPYGLDRLEFQNNYESPKIDEQGDIVRATFRNHLADIVLNLEAELLSICHSYSGDMLVSCVTAQVNDWVPGTSCSVMIPPETLDFILQGVPAGQNLQNTTLPIVMQASARPIDKFAIWDQYDFRGAMHIATTISGNSVVFKIIDPVGYLALHSSYSGDPNLGNFILSIIFFRQR